MKFKLALKNVRRQLGNYGIYFITVTMTVALMFAMNNVLYNDQIRVFAGIMKDLHQGLDFLLWFIAMVTAFVLGYGTSFMLRLRKREFGTYMILGMKRKDVMGIFLAETLFLAAAALISGILLGLVVYQAMMAVVCRLMEVPLMFSGYSLDALKMTVILVLVIFALASAASAFYLRKVTIYQLLYGTEKSPTKPEPMGVFGAAVLGWHISLTKCLMHGLMKSKKLCSRGTNTFVLRQLWDRLSSNALMAGLLAVLLTFAVAGANISFTQKASAQASLDRTVPFDIVGCLDPSADYAYDFDQAGDIIESVVPVRETLDYNVYIDGTRPVTSAVGFTVAYDNDSSAASLMEQSGPPDYYVRLSDFNRFAAALGQETLPEDGRFYIVSDISLSLELPEDMILEKNGINAEYGGFIGSFPRIAFVYYVVVVPDAMTRGMDIAYMYRNFTLQHNDFDSEALYRALSYRTTDWNFGEKDQCDYEIKAYTRMENNSTSAILVVGALYIAMIFVFMAMAVLALKTLAGIDEDRRRFRTMYQIGTAPRVLKQTLFRQIFIFFFFPAVLPVALSPIIAWMCARIVTLSGFAELSMTLYLNGAVIALLILGIYALYFGAAWQIARRHVFQ